MFLLSSRTLLVRVLALEVVDAVADALVAEDVEVLLTEISESLVVAVVVELQDMVVDLVDLLLRLMAVDSGGPLPLLLMVALHLTAVAVVDMVADPTETHPEVAAANPGGKLILYDVSSFPARFR